MYRKILIGGKKMRNVTLSYKTLPPKYWLLRRRMYEVSKFSVGKAGLVVSKKHAALKPVIFSNVIFRQK